MAEADAFAMEYFMSICGLNRDGEKYQRMLKQGMDMKDRISEKLISAQSFLPFPGKQSRTTKQL